MPRYPSLVPPSSPTVGVLELQPNPALTEPSLSPSPGARRERMSFTAEKVGAHTPQSWKKLGAGGVRGRGEGAGGGKAASGCATLSNPRSLLPCFLCARWAPSTMRVARRAQGEAGLDSSCFDLRAPVPSTAARLPRDLQSVPTSVSAERSDVSKSVSKLGKGGEWRGDGEGGGMQTASQSFPLKASKVSTSSKRMEPI